VLPLAPEPEAASPTDASPTGAAPLDDSGEALLAPAAGPETGAAGPGGFAYEEPVPGPSAQEIEAMVRDSGLAPVAAQPIAGPEVPLWQRNALALGDTGGRPMIAVVIDDVGVNPVNARRAIALPGPLTLAFMTYASGLEAMTAEARAAGHELMLHVPMEPRDPAWDPGPNVLAADLGQEELRRRLLWALERFDGYVGINNHMGSKFTGSLLGMVQVMAELKSRGLLFLDSMTSGSSLGIGLARRMGVAHVDRDVCLENEPDSPEAIRWQLAKLETIARRHGAAVAIGHPHEATLEVLAAWLAEVEDRGFALVPISAIVRREIALAEAREAGDLAAARP
jgi:polysaccharide deacetylase 2 family uncharacterized protein YibQ